MATDTETLTAYQGILRRSIPLAEAAIIGAGFPTVAALLAHLKGSAENINFVVPAIRSMQWVLGRRPDSAGLDYWAGVLRGGGSVATMYASMLASTEGQSKYPSSSTNAVFVNNAYSRILGRTPSSSESSYWVGQLTGGMSRGNVLFNIGESSEAVNRIATPISNWQSSAGVGSGVYSGSFF